MAKRYNDRQMVNDSPEQEYFFPRHNPPITVLARSRKEAEQKLEEIDNPKEV